MGKWSNYVNDDKSSMYNSAGDYTGGRDNYVPEPSYEPAPSAPEPQEPVNSGFQLPQEVFKFDTIQPQSQPEEEGPRAWDIHYTPTWFVEEQENRKNPEYKSTAPEMSGAFVDAIANYVNQSKKVNPNDWRYGDPGWKTDGALWQETIKPLEQQYQEQQRQAEIIRQQEQAQQLQAQKQQQEQEKLTSNNPFLKWSLFNSSQEPIASDDEIKKLDTDLASTDSRYKNLDVNKNAPEADVSKLSRSGKALYYGMPSQAGTDVKNASALARYTQPIVGSIMSGSGIGNLAKVGVGLASGPAGWAMLAGWGATSLYTYGKSIGLYDGVPALDKIIEMTDILDEKGAQIQGALAYGYEKAGGGDLTDWSKAGENLAFWADNFGEIMHYAFGSGKASSEYNSDVVGLVTALTPNMGANAIGINGQGASRFVRSAMSLVDNPEDRVWLERNQTTKSNMGLAGVYEIPEEMLGSNAVPYWLDYAQYLYDHGVKNLGQLELILNQKMGEVYGDLANMSEFIEHEVGDPGNTMDAMNPRLATAYGKVTNDANIVKAGQANTGSFAMDVAGQVPGLQGLIETVGRAFGKEIRGSGSFEDVMNTWDMENLASEPSQLTARDKRHSGINPDGTLKSLDVLKNPNEVTNPFERGMERIKNLFSTTNEWRATMVGDSIFNFINVGIEDAFKARPNEDPQVQIDRVMRFVDELENPDTISPESPFASASKSILFNSIKEDLSLAVRTERQAINKIIQDYGNLQNNRQVLNTLSNSLNMTPDKLLDMAQNKKTVLAQMILNKADENGGKIPGIDIDVESRAFTDRVMSMITPFTGDNAKAYDPRQVMLQITSKIGDGVTDTLLNKYGIQQEGWMFRFGDTIKKMQHLWLLGLSPSYLANNVVNNVLTRSAIGYGGWLSPKAINNWNERFGFTPERFNESMVDSALETAKNRNNMTNAEKMREAIRDKKKAGYDFFGKVDKASDWVSNHAGFFGKISGKVEEMESRQIMASSMMTYMARTWKPGVNYRKMPTQLENMIRAQNPAMVDAIYSAINSGMNMTEIENAIYGTYVIPSVRDSLVQSARELGVSNPEDFVTEYFDKSGFMAEFTEALKGKRGNEINEVITRAEGKLKAMLLDGLAKDLGSRAEQVANDTSAYKFSEAVNLARDISTQMGDLWANTQMMNTSLFNQRIAENMPREQFRDIYVKQQQALNERWAGIYATSLQTYNGIVKGLGFGDKTSKTFLDNMKARDNVWITFYGKTQPETIQPYLDALVWQTGDNTATWDSRVKQAWADYAEAMRTKYEQAVKAEATAQKKMDDAFVKGLKESLGTINAKKVDEVIAPKLEEIRAKREEIVAKNNEVREKVDKINLVNGKNDVWAEAQDELTELKNQYTILQQELYNEIYAMGPQTVDTIPDTTMTDEDHIANIRIAETQKEAEAQKETAQKFDDTMTNRVFVVDENGETQVKTPVEFAYDNNFTPENLEQAMQNYKLYDSAIDAGTTDEEAKAYVKYASEQKQNESEQIQTGTQVQTVTPEQAQQILVNGHFVPLDQIDLTKLPETEKKEAVARRLASRIVDSVNAQYADEVSSLSSALNTTMTEQAKVEKNSKEWKQFEKRRKQLEKNLNWVKKSEAYRKQFTADDYYNYLMGTNQNQETQRRIWTNIESIPHDSENLIHNQIKALQRNMISSYTIPVKGDYVVQTTSFEHGKYKNIVGAVYHDGEVVAYVPQGWTTTTIDLGNDKTAKVIGVSVNNPEQWMYMVGDEVFTETQPQPTGNVFKPTMPQDSLGALDPMAQAHHEVAYEQALPILQRFTELYKQAIDNALTNNKFGDLSDEAKTMLRSYIDNIVRTDLMNTKFKAGKFGEMIRDSALLNYSKRYGFDNYLTLLFPYQFWQTRSMMNWMKRMGDKGGKIWRRYARLKELEERNKKEAMPSKITGKAGIYIPGLPDWMGDALFMPTSQLSIVGNFMDPVYDWISDKNSILATAERYVKEAFENEDISFAEYQMAMDPAQRDKSTAWQEAYSKATLEGQNEKDLGSLFEQYFGMALPVSVGKALLTGNTDDWNQFPMTRTGTAWRAILGDNFVGEAGKNILSAPEKMMRSLAVKLTGNDDFAYNEFGNWGDYYIRNQVWDMVVEGRIDPQEAITATTEKDGNKIWEEASDRQRQEILQKTQLLSTTAPMKKIVSDIQKGADQQTMREDWMYLLANLMTMWTPTTVVREAEQEWRQTKADVDKTYVNNDKEAREKIYDENPNYTYNNLRYENDPEQALRKYLYKSITDVYYDLSKEEKLELNMTFGGDFIKDVIDKDTRAIETMDINRLWGYAQAMHGHTPFIATDKLNEVGVNNPAQFNRFVIPENEKNAHQIYVQERDRLYPGMSEVNSLYYNLPVDERKIFRQANPKLQEYWNWNTNYKNQHPEVKSYNDKQTQYYDILEAENACALFDQFTLKELYRASYSNTDVDKAYTDSIEYVMRQVGSSKSTKDFIKLIKGYILGQ